jgi:hypothetical protein
LIKRKPREPRNTKKLRRKMLICAYLLISFLETL